MHIDFHLAGTIFYMRCQLINFLDKYCRPRGGLTAALKKDIQDHCILEHLRMLGLVGKFITGPWMTILYKEEEENLHSSPHLKKCENPEILNISPVDAFERLIDPCKDIVLNSLLTAGPFNTDCVRMVASAILDVCQRQLTFYLKSEDFTPEQLAAGKAAPVHNMQAERIMPCVTHKPNECQTSHHSTLTLGSSPALITPSDGLRGFQKKSESVL